jgi:hypothetical protein
MASPLFEDEAMDTVISPYSRERYAKCIEASRRVRWEIDRDVIRGRDFDYTRHFLPDALARMDRFDFLDAGERRLLSQVQGRTYANMFALVERFIGAKMMELTRHHALGDQVVAESLVRLTDEELKHQELFRRLEAMMAAGMPAGYRFLPPANDVANAVLGKSDWAVLGLTCCIEIFSLTHYRQSIADVEGICPLWKDVFLFHMKEESQHAILDEMEWQREDAGLTSAARDAAVDDLIALVAAVDGLVRLQAGADAQYFSAVNARRLPPGDAARLADGLVAAYRWQYILSGVQVPRFQEVLRPMVNDEQMGRIGTALAPIAAAA